MLKTQQKHAFKERYDLLAREKMSLEEQVETLDGVVDHFSKRIEMLVEEKKVLETQVEIGRGQLEA